VTAEPNDGMFEPSAWEWARAQWSGAALGDVRRTRRAVAVGAAMAEASASGLPQQMGSWAATKAAYRLMDCEDVTHEGVSAPHWRASREAAAAHDGPVFFVQDGTCVDLTRHAALEDAGRIGDHRGRGFCVHSCLAVGSGTGAVLGLAHQAVWTRPEQPHKGRETRAERARRRTEADAWAECLEAIGPVPEGAVGVSVGDRGADVFTHLTRARALGWHCLVRVCQDRALGDGGRLLKALRVEPPRTTRTVSLRGPDGRLRERTFQVAWRAVSLQAAKRGPRAEPLDAWAVRAWDDDGEWVLLSTRPLEDATAAEHTLDDYARRWIIEDFHKALKTGCRLEQRQLRTAARFTTLLGFLSLIAVRLLQLRGQARSAPEAAADQPAATQALLAAVLKVPATTVATHHGFWHGVARLGGFLARKSDGEPGWQTLWLGWQKLQLLLEGAQLVRTTNLKCG
jgi:Transposase DNA-binding/Transposase Tn5 dimerisation domain